MSAETTDQRDLDLTGITSVEAASFNGGVTVYAGDESPRLQAIVDGKATYEVERLGSLLYIAGKKRGLTYSGSSVSFTLWLPPGLALKLASINAPVRVSGPVRALEASTYRGDLVTENTGEGPLSFKLAGGAVRCSGARGQVKISSSNAELTVYDAAAGVHISSGSGRIQASVVTGPVHISSGTGAISLADINGKTNIATGHGAIRVARLRGDLHIATGWGGIEIEDVEGQIQAVTGYEAVRLERVTLPPGSRNWLKTGGGIADIRGLRAPGGLRLHAKHYQGDLPDTLAGALPGYTVAVSGRSLKAELPGARPAKLEIVTPGGVRITA